MPIQPPPPYISSKDAAQKYGLTNDHIGLLCRRGKVQGLLWGRVWYISEPTLVSYLEKTFALKEARKQTLSKQWRAAWTTAFIGFSLYALNPHNVAADYVSVPVELPQTPEPIAFSLAAIVDTLTNFKNNLSVPTLAAVETAVDDVEVDKSFVPGISFGTQVVLGVTQIKETVSDIFAQKGTLVRVVYATDVAQEQESVAQIADPFSSVLAAAAVQTQAATEAVDAPDLSYEAPPPVPLLLTTQNIFVGTQVANESLYAFNQAMFSAYAQSVQQLASIAAFDTAQGAHVWNKTFGAFGEQFVGDVHHLGQAQASWYVSSARSLEHGYNDLADAVGNTAAFSNSISVASVAYTPSLTSAVGESGVGAWWSGAVQFVSNIFAGFSSSEETITVTPAEPLSQSSSGQPAASTRTFAQDVPPASGVEEEQQPPLAVVLPTPTRPKQNPVAEPATSEGFVQASLITQTSLNKQFDAWMQVVRALIAGQGNATGYVDNPGVAAGGNYQGGGNTIINNYALAQRIDKLDGVTITNSSINGVSNFSNLGGGASALTNLSDTLVVSPTYGDLLLFNGIKWVNTATSSLGIAGGSSSLIGTVGQLAYFSGTNTAVGTSSIYISTSGKIGIGTTSPYAALSVVGASGVVAGKYTATSTATSTFAGAIQATCFSVDGTTCITSGSGSSFSYLFPNNATTTGLGIYASTTIGNGTQAGGLTISGGATTTGNAYFAGNVGIGTTSPTTLLHVYSALTSQTLARFVGGGSDSSIIVNSAAAGGTPRYILQSNTTNKYAFLSDGADSDKFKINTGSSLSTNLFTLTSTGNLGLGTTSPWAKFSINNSTNDTAGQPLFVVASSTASATTTAFIITNAGFVGVGTSSPYAKLSVVGEVVGANFTATSTTATTTLAGGLNVGSGAINYDFSSGVTSINNLALGAFTFDTDAGIVSWADLPISSSATAGTVESYTANIGGTSVLTIYGEADGSGNAQNTRVGIGTTTPTAVLQIENNSTGIYRLLINDTRIDGGSGSGEISFRRNMTEVGSITTSPTATSYNTTSDRRTKENIATTTLGLDKLMQLPVREFNFINDPSHASTTGFIAQELFKIFPYAVTTNGDNGEVALGTSSPWSVDYGRITPLLVKAVQDVANITSTFKNNLIVWLADASNGITKLFAKEVHTDKLCVGETCITQEQFLAMVAASGSHAEAQAPAPTPEPEPEPEATSTPPVDENASSTPETSTPLPDVPLVDESASSTSETPAL